MKQLDFGFPIPEGYEVVFRASITLKNGTVIVATLAAGLAAIKGIRMYQKHKQP